MMMVVRPQNCIRNNRFNTETLASPSLRPLRNPNPNQMWSRRRKRSPSGFSDNVNCGDRRKSRNQMVERKAPAQKLVMGQVKILKRGEELMLGSGDEDLVLSSTDRLGPDPDTVQKQIRVNGLYVGSAASVESPPPSSLPFPAAFAKKEMHNDAATCDLRRLLRLDLI